MLGVGVVMMTAPLVWRFFRFFWRLGAEIGLELQVASTLVPSPAEISFHLQAEWAALRHCKKWRPSTKC